MNGLADEFGYPPAYADEVERLRNLSSREILRQSKVSIFKLPALVRRIKIELNREIASLLPISGMTNALLTLKAEGHCLGIVTSNSKDNVDEFLKAQGLGHLFDFIYSGTSLFGKDRIIQRILRKNNFSFEHVIYVGDETRDIEAAQKIPVKVVAVGWGFNSVQALAQYYPDFLINHPHELVDIARHLSQSA